MKEIYRINKINEIKEKLKTAPIIGILGPRQCGKTTLTRSFLETIKKTPISFFDLEDPRDFELFENPLFLLENLTGIIVIDEIQIKPSLFNILRVIVDQKRDQKFIILGSASQALVAHSSDTLAGRISYVELSGFSNHIEGLITKRLWERGGFPLSYLSKKTKHSYQWRQDFITTFLERDIPQLGIKIPARSLRRFWTMLSHYHGQVCNYSELGRSLNISDNTVRRYIDILEGTFMIRLLQPYFYNTKKRITKQPKLYIRDSGIFHTLQSIETYTDLQSHPKLGASWEGFAIEQLSIVLQKRNEELYYWKLQSGAELDLLTFLNGKPVGFEIKFNESPKITPSMKSAIQELKLSHLYILHPGKNHLQISEKITLLPITQLKTLLN